MQITLAACPHLDHGRVAGAARQRCPRALMASGRGVASFRHSYPQFDGWDRVTLRKVEGGLPPAFALLLQNLAPGRSSEKRSRN